MTPRAIALQLAITVAASLIVAALVANVPALAKLTGRPQP